MFLRLHHIETTMRVSYCTPSRPLTGEVRLECLLRLLDAESELVCVRAQFASLVVVQQRLFEVALVVECICLAQQVPAFVGEVRRVVLNMKNNASSRMSFNNEWFFLCSLRW